MILMPDCSTIILEKCCVKVVKQMVKILQVESGSIGEEQGILPGDWLVSINEHEIQDVLDYRFYLADTVVSLEIKRDGQSLFAEVEKEEDEDLGLVFETPLMDKKQCCANRCIFCFIDQLPKGMRDSLYFKDDDSRLSFIHGNYITLTNLRDKDIQRLIDMHISPINVSIHTTNPELRVRMMKNQRAGRVLSYLRRLADAGNALCGQIVLCRGVNDGKELDRTLKDLLDYYPALRSVSVVPAGLTKFRDGLYPLASFTKEEAAQVIEQVNRAGEACLERFGTRLFYCADEWYLKAGLPLPGDAYYEDYSQIENGVGLLTSLETDITRELEFKDEYRAEFKGPRHVTIVTGMAAEGTIRRITRKMEEAFEGFHGQVIPIVNHYFGESITVSGLLTGKDVVEQLAGKELYDELLLPANMLRAEKDVFLDGMTPAELSEQLHVPVHFCEDMSPAFIRGFLGIREKE